MTPQGPIILSDLDGTIANIDHRLHLVEGGGKKDFKRFDAACVDDPPNLPVIKLLRAMRSCGYRIIIVSGRSERERAATERWLKLHTVPWARLYMRERDDYRPDVELKQSFLDKFIILDEVLFVLDDRAKMVAFWRAQGFACFQVSGR